MFFRLRLPSLQSTWLLQRDLVLFATPPVVSVLPPFQLGCFLLLNFNLRLNLNLVFSCFLGNLQSLFCNFFLRDIVLLVSACSWHCSFCSFDSFLLLGTLFSPAVGCALLASCWLCSSRQLLAVLFLPAVGYALLPAVGFCHFVQLSEILVDLLLVVVQVLRLCAPFRLSGFASLFDFFSPPALLAVVLSLFSVFWRRLLQHYFVVVHFSEVRLKHLQRHNSALRHFAIIGSRKCSGLLFVRSGFTPSGLGDSLPLRFVGGLQHHCVTLVTA